MPYPTSLPSSSPATHQVVNDEIVAIATELGITGAANKRGLLASVSYNPAVLEAPSTTSSTFADVDATNVVITFTAPASGVVLVQVVVSADTAAASHTHGINLREGAADIAGTEREVAFAGNRMIISVAAKWKITGLTAGNSYTYKLGHARKFGATNATTCRYGGAAGPVVLSVWAA